MSVIIGNNIYTSGSQCVVNGHSISFRGNQVYIDGRLYVPSDGTDNDESSNDESRKMVVNKILTGAFDQIEVHSIFDAHIQVDDTVDPQNPSVTIRAPEFLMRDIRADVVDDCLVLDIEHHGMMHLDPEEYPQATIMVHSLLAVSSSGQSDVELVGDVKSGPILGLRASGASGLDATQYSACVDKLLVSTSGSSNLTVDTLSAKNAQLTSSGSSNLKIGTLKAGEVLARSSGSSNLTIVKGTADDVGLSSSGSSDLKAAGLRAKTGMAKSSGSSDLRCSVAKLQSSLSSGTSSIYNS